MLLAQLFLGLVPDAPRGRCYLSPWLPDWLPRLELRGIKVGRGTVAVRATRTRGETAIEEVRGDGIEVVGGWVEAPLRGAPPGPS